MDRKQIIDALQTLKECCVSNGFCQDCQLYSERRKKCGVVELSPKDWNINKQNDVTIWKH